MGSKYFLHEKNYFILYKKLQIQIKKVMQIFKLMTIYIDKQEKSLTITER